MFNLYNHNGLVFWNEQAIRVREVIQTHIVEGVRLMLRDMNKAFELFRIEAPILTPLTQINPNYSTEDFYAVDDLALRPETTMGSYAYAQYLLTSHKKVKMPLCVWQSGKSFRKEQDQPTKHMRLKEFYQLEFQCIYSKTTANDYTAHAIPLIQGLLSDMVANECEIMASDRLPSYSTQTTDIVTNGMEICSISKRTDFPDAHVLEIAVGLDRMVYQHGSNFFSFTD